MEEWLRRFLRVALRMLVPLLAYEMAHGLVFAAWSFWMGEPGQEQMLPLTAVSAVLTVFPLSWFCPGGARRRSPGFRGAWAMGENGTFRKDILLPTAAGIGACLCLNHLLMLLPFSKGGWQETAETIYRPSLLVQIFCTGLVIPAVEELIFRGYAFRSLRREMSFFPAAMISAIYFGLFHGAFYQGCYAFLVGLLLAAVCEWRRGLLAAWILHSVANLTSIVLTVRGINGYVMENTAWMAVTAALGGVVAACSVYRMRGK